MKSQPVKGQLRALSSLPVWEEWIEIVPVPRVTGIAVSLPVWEEWIEIRSDCARLPNVMSLPVWEEWIEIAKLTAKAAVTDVSSRMGRVD